MRWLSDFDNSFDALLTESYRQREMDMEYHINRIRFAGLMVLFTLELGLSLAVRGLDYYLLAFDLGSMSLTAAWCWQVARWAKAKTYLPWLKYLSILFDFGLILLITIELTYLAEIGHFLRNISTTQFELMVIGALLLFNVLSALRQGKLIIYYSTLLCFACTFIILEHSHVERTIEFHELVLILCSGLLAWSISQYITTTFTRLRHRERLLRYLPQKLVSAVEQGTVDIEPGGERRPVTVLMADIRGFTQLCEQHEPETVTTMLNLYFAAMSEEIFSQEGMIDKFIGDAIMAVFGIPSEQEHNNSAQRSINAARQMLARVDALNTLFTKQGLPTISIGIGIHSGDAIAGNVGSSSRMDYTVIGDTVNVAARIESLTKELQQPMLVSAATAEKSGDTTLTLITEAKLRGRHESVTLYG